MRHRLALIALWGKTPIEDGLFNLAGLLAPVVAFVPAKNDGRCLPADPLAQVTLTVQERADVLAANLTASREANQAAISNNMESYLIVVAVVIVGLALIGAISHFWIQWPLIEDNKVAFWLPLVAAFVLWLLGGWQYVNRNEHDGNSWFYQHVHFTSAIVMFVFITLGILWIGVTRWLGALRITVPPPAWYRIDRPLRIAFNACLGDPPLSPTQNTGWAIIYIGQATLMFAASGAMFGLAAADWGPSWFLDHHVFWIELWMILNVALFWLLQTSERWDEGAPLLAAELPAG